MIIRIFKFLFGQFTLGVSGGGGGGSSGTPYYANQDKLWGTQADIAQNLYNQYASLAPGYLQNSMEMTDEAMSGKLADKMRQQAGNDAAATNGNAWAAANRSMARMGAGFSSDRLLSEANRNAIMGAANTTGALNSATAAAEDMKWNRNANAYGQIAGMGSGAMQGMSSAASGYGQMSGQIAANNAANAAGYGKFGASMVSGSRWADGGYIDKRGLKLAQGAYVRGSQAVLKPDGYKQQVLSMPFADWENQATSGNPGGTRGGVNPLAAIAAGAAPYLMGDALRGVSKDLWKTSKDALVKYYDEYRARQAENEAAAQADASAGYTGAEAFGIQGGGANAVDWAAQDAADEAWLNEDFASGGYVRKPGLRFATGGYAESISGNYDSDPDRFRGDTMSADEMAMRRAAGTMANMGASYGIKEGAKAAWNAATAPDPSKSFVSSTAETPGVATTTPVANSGAGVMQTASYPATSGSGEVASGAAPDAATGATTDAAATSATTDAATTGATTGAATGAATDAAAGTAIDVATGAATDAAAGVAADAAAAAAADAAASAAGEEALSYLALLLLKDGGPVERRGLRFATGGYAQPISGQYASNPNQFNSRAPKDLWGKMGDGIERGAGQDMLHAVGVDTPAEQNDAQKFASMTNDPGLTYIANKVFARGGRVDQTAGGKVAGPGTETSDDIPAWLSDGEFVLNAEAVKLIGKSKLEALNQRGLKMRGQKSGGAKKAQKGSGLKLAKGGAVKKGC